MLIFINIVPYPRGTQLSVAAFVAAFTDKMIQTQEEHDMFRSKPNHCISLRRNMSCSSLYLIKTATGCIAQLVTTYKLHTIKSSILS